jgi:hypothetical protein
MTSFLRRFAVLVAGVLQGFDRLVFKGKLPQLYGPEGMHCVLGVNHVPRVQFKSYSAEVTKQVLEASWIARAKQLDRFRYLNSTKTDKEELAREIAAKQGVHEGLVCVLQCVEPCWTFDSVRNEDGHRIIRGEAGKCSHLYHYLIHPLFGWMYLRLQTWFPFEIQIGINGREWLGRQMDQAHMKYERSRNKFRWVEDWQRAQQLLDEQLQTDWVRELDALQQRFHPLHPGHMGDMHLRYNWTVFQSEWATDVAFRSAQMLEPWFDRWLRQAFLSYDSVDVLRFLGRAERISKQGTMEVETNLHDCFEGRRIKHWLGRNSLKLYSHDNVLRTEMTINNPKAIFVMRRSENDPKWPAMPRPIRRNVVDLPHRAQVGQQVNERYLEALASLAETRTVQELAEPLTRRVPEPNKKTDAAARKVRGLNPLAADDAALLTAISKPEWMMQGVRNRDLVAALFKTEPQDAQERRRRSAHVTRLLRLLRAHELLQKIPHTHRYQITADARNKIQALLAVRNANPDELTAKAA